MLAIPIYGGSGLPAIQGQTRRRLRIIRNQYGIDELQWYLESSLWVTEFDAAGVKTTTTLTAELTAGADYMDVADASTFAKGQGVCIPGAGPGGAELAVTINQYVGANRIYFTPSTSTTVPIGTTIYHDDTAAIKTAMATGQNIFVPTGHYNTLGGGQTRFDITTVAQCVKGNGNDFRSLVNGSIIWSRSLDQDVFMMKGENSKLAQLTVAQEATITPTAGAGVSLGEIDMGADTTTAVFHGRVEDVGIRNLYDGFRTAWGVGCWIDMVYVLNPRRYGFHFNAPAPVGGNRYTRMQAHLRGDAPWRNDVIAGFYFENCDSTEFDVIAITGFKNNLYYNTNNNIPGYAWSGGQPGCFQHTWTNLLLEIPSVANEPIIKIVAGYAIERVKCTGLEIGGSVYASGTNLKDLGITGFTQTIHASEPIGFEIAGGTGTHIGSGDVSGSNVAGSIAIKIGSAAVGTRFTNVVTRGFAKNLRIDNGATKITVGDCDFSSYLYGGKAYEFGDSVEQEMTIRNNGRFTGNTGLPDYGPSKDYTPGWIGQRVLVDGVFYDAINTTSVDDWKAAGGGTGGGNIDGGWFLDPTNPATTYDGGTFA